jgi:hypothetical protein
MSATGVARSHEPAALRSRIPEARRAQHHALATARGDDRLPVLEGDKVPRHQPLIGLGAKRPIMRLGRAERLQRLPLTVLEGALDIVFHVRFS